MPRIDPEIKPIIRARSKGICERCHRQPAAHMHHLTYERAGHERPSDIEHVCLDCHGAYHPHHNFKPWQLQRRTVAKRKRKSNNPWAQQKDDARRALANSARFNKLPMSSRKAGAL